MYTHSPICDVRNRIHVIEPENEMSLTSNRTFILLYEHKININFSLRISFCARQQPHRFRRHHRPRKKTTPTTFGWPIYPNV